MSPLDYILIALIAAAVCGAAILMIRRRKNGSSCCESCPSYGTCQKRKKTSRS